MSALYLVDRDCLLRAIFNTGQAVDALGHVHRICLAAFNFEYRLGANIRAGSVAIALALVDRYHVHGAAFLLLVNSVREQVPECNPCRDAALTLLPIALPQDDHRRTRSQLPPRQDFCRRMLLER